LLLLLLTGRGVSHRAEISNHFRPYNQYQNTKMARKKMRVDSDEEFVLPDQDTSSDEEECYSEEEEYSELQPALTQGTSDAVNSLLFFGQGPVVYETRLHDSVRTPDDDNERELAVELAEEAQEEDQDGEVQVLGVQHCQPFVPHPNLVAQVKFENTPPTNAGAVAQWRPTVAAVPGPPPPLRTAVALADALEVDNNGSLDLDEDELELLSSAANTGKRTKKTEDKITNLIKRWFTTIHDHGGDILRKNLLIMEPAEYSGGRIQDYAFFNMLGGEKTPAKTAILNKCCILCGMKWLCLTGKGKGKTLAPVSFTKYMSTIFNEFRMKKGMTYDFRTDFNDKGQFHGVMIVNWNRIRQKDPKFGTKQHQAQFDWEADTKIRDAIQDGRLKPYKDPVHLQLVVLYVLGRQFLLRGCKEMSMLNHHDTYGGVYGREMGELAGNEYEAIQIPESKTNQLSLDNPTALSKKDQVIEIAENPYDIICPVKLLRFYKDRCHPQAFKFFAKVATLSKKQSSTKMRFQTKRTSGTNPQLPN
jgi:hypothetical protein